MSLEKPLRPCKYGHIAERTKSGNCKMCHRLWKAEARKRDGGASRKAYYAKNRERERESNRVYMAANAARLAQYRANYSEENRELLSEKNSEWRKSHPDYLRQHRKSNPERYRIYRENRRARLAGGKLSPDIVALLLAKQGGRCACCDDLLNGSYHLDHVIPLCKGGSNTDENVQLLLPRCNLRKGRSLPS